MSCSLSFDASGSRLSTFVDATYLYIGMFNDPSTSGSAGFWLSRSSYQPESVSASARRFNLTQKLLAIDFQCSPSIICLWTSQNRVDEYSMTSLTYVRSRLVSESPLKYNPALAKNVSDKMSYYFHRSVNIAGNPYLLYKRNETFQQISSVTLPYQINFSDSIPEFGVSVRPNTNVFVGFTTSLNATISYGDNEIVLGAPMGNWIHPVQFPVTV
ncbi:hypothetical protein BKA69DRAFT_819474 [Paraphysoderma sedebokerense]|nr:hypothetical protein BKA69DRAFT_819474 [Paraphysoderma sedebokerense]